jgi:hypothetical protein
MRRIQLPVTMLCVLTAVHSPGQDDVGYNATSVGFTSACNTGGCNYGGLGFNGAQLYPFDQQDPWLHGQHQRVPSYGGYSSFRPYNYRHIAPQSQIAANFGGAGGMAYSQQFWNRYREAYLNQNLHYRSDEAGMVSPPDNIPSRQKPIMYSTEGVPQAQQLIRLPPVMRQTSLPFSGPSVSSNSAAAASIYPAGVVGR